MSGLVFEIEGLNASRHAEQGGPPPLGFPEQAEPTRMEGIKFQEEGLNASLHAPGADPATPHSDLGNTAIDTVAHTRHENGKTREGKTPSPTGQGKERERGVEPTQATETLGSAERERPADRTGKPLRSQDEEWKVVQKKKKGQPKVPSYASIAKAPAPNQSSPPELVTPLAGHATTTTPTAFWVQWIIPQVDDGKVAAEDVKRELRKNKPTAFLEPQASQFQYANRAILSDRIRGGWYVSFRIPKGPEGAQARSAYHTLRADGLKMFGKTVKPKRAPRASPGSLCTICCQFGHSAWKCYGRAPRCTLCAGPHWWGNHKCNIDKCTAPTGAFCQDHEKLKCVKCAKEHAAGSSQCDKRPKGRDTSRPTAARGDGGAAPRPQTPPSRW